MPRSQIPVFLVLFLLSCCKSPRTAVEPTVETPPAEGSAVEPVSEPDPAAPNTEEAPTSFVPDTPRQEELRGVVGAALDSGDLDLAIAASIAMMETTERSGMRASGMALLAHLYLEEGESDRAVEILTRVIDESPPVGEFHLALGKVLGELNRFEEAEEHLRAGIEIRPELLQAYIYLGSLLYTTGQIEEAEAVYVSYEDALTRMLALVSDDEQPLSSRLEAFELLSLAIPDDRLTAAMVELLPHENFTIAVGAVRVLSDVGTASAIPALQAFADSAEEERVADFAGLAIRTIRTREGM